MRVCRVLLDSRFRGNDVTGAMGMTVAGAGWMRAMGNDGGGRRMDEGDGE